LRRVFALRGNRREALRDVVLGGPNDGDATRILCDRRIGNRERQCERERDDGRGFEHSPSPSPRRWLAAWERTVWRDGWPVIKRLPDCPAARWDASSRDRRRTAGEEPESTAGFALVATLTTALAKLKAGLSSQGPPARGPHAAGKLDDAVAAYFTTLSKDPKNQFAYYNLGEIAQRQSRFVAAESYYRIALEMDPKMVSALFNLAIVRTNAGATNEAIALYRQAIAVDANYAAAHFNLGLLLRQ